MRRIVVFNRVTADGSFASKEGKLDWVVPDDELDKNAEASIGTYDCMLFGRKTYDMFESFWPKALDDPKTAPDPHADGRRSPAIHAMAVWLNDAEKQVFSRTRKSATWKNSHLLHTFEPRAIEALKARPGKDIIVFGSGSLVSQLTQHGLVDEYQLVMSPVFIGGGRQMLSELPGPTRLQLRDVKRYPSGTLLLTYGRAA